MSNDKYIPAFPMSTIDGYSQQGMSLRDYFAANSLQAAFDSYSNGYRANNAKTPAKNIAEIAFELADAMLEARK